jgi:hypothetical protein
VRRFIHVGRLAVDQQCAQAGIMHIGLFRTSGRWV